MTPLGRVVLVALLAVALFLALLTVGVQIVDEQRGAPPAPRVELPE